MSVSTAANVASALEPDWLARTLAILGLVAAITSIAITWYLWRKSGPEIVVIINTATSQRTPVPEGFDEVVDVEIRNAGRMPAMIREVNLRIWDQEPSRRRGVSPTRLTLEPTYGAFPVAAPPTGYVSAKMADGTGLSAGTIVQAVAVTGAGQVYESSLKQITGPHHPAGYLPRDTPPGAGRRRPGSP
jgi:hypothetical protein